MHHGIIRQYQREAVDAAHTALQATTHEREAVSIVPYSHSVRLNRVTPRSRSVEDFSYRKCINRLLRDDWDASLPRLLQFRSWVTRIVAAPEAGPQEVRGHLCLLWVCGSCCCCLTASTIAVTRHTAESSPKYGVKE